MPKMNCNIIKDLLPSYLDEICSKESAQMIEEHLSECEKCRKIYEQCKLEMLHTNSTTSKEVDYFKKIKHNVFRKNKVILIIIASLFILMLYSNLYAFRFGNYFTMYLNYLFPILVAGLLFAVLPDYAENPVPNKIKFTVLSIEFIAMTYIFGLMLFVGNSILNGIIPFGMEINELGPFLQTQIYFVALGFLIAFIITLFLSMRKKAICPALHFVPLGGLALMFEYERLLHELTSRFVLSMFVKPYVIFACEIIVLVGIYMFVNRKKVS